ncbi:universal stress protein [Rhizobium sp. PP-CC-3G-465]|uniref:universal stress protein n=1 Tax=Rhizobium sp. PP-CC-3G-465 TaxID=2135648 RepID=UPI001FDF9781
MMSYKSILAIVRVDHSERELRDAVDFCAEADAHLSVLIVQLASPPPIGDAMIISSVWLEERESEKASLDAYIEKVKDIVSATGISCSVEGTYAEAASAEENLGMRARYSDLTIIGSDLELDRDLFSTAVEGCLFRSARPAILAPRGGGVSLRPAKVMIAWDSSLESARAVGAALDLISQAECVHVVVVDPNTGARKNGDEPGADIALYLSRHSANVIVDQLPAMGRSVAEVLQQHATDMGANMIVMGAYGHSRLRERVFGGVTKSMIASRETPVFMAH